jgi:hypothetical protein
LIVLEQTTCSPSCLTPTPIRIIEMIRSTGLKSVRTYPVPDQGKLEENVNEMATNPPTIAGPKTYWFRTKDLITSPVPSQ